MGKTYSSEDLARRIFLIVMVGVGLEIAAMLLVAL
jgi:hypothetical protein